MAENAKTLIEALAAAQGEIDNAPLNQTNPHFRSRYADLAAIRDAVIPALSKHGIALVQVIEIREYGPAIITRLLKGEDVIESECPIAVGQTYKPQEFGSACTYARRYSMAAICGIAAEEDDDANAAQDASKNAPASKPAQAKRGNGKPAADPAAQQAKFFTRDNLRIPVPTTKDGGDTDWQGWEGKMRKACDAAPDADAVNRLWQDNGDALGRLKEASAKGYDMLDRHFSERAAALSPSLAEAAA